MLVSFFKEKTNHYLINIGSGYENTIKGYAKFIMKKLNVNLKIVYDKKNLTVPQEKNLT